MLSVQPPRWRSSGNLSAKTSALMQRSGNSYNTQYYVSRASETGFSTSRTQEREGLGGGRGAVFHTELPEDMLDVLLDRADARAEDRCDVGVRLALGNPGEDFGLSPREAQRGELLRPEGRVAL